MEPIDVGGRRPPSGLEELKDYEQELQAKWKTALADGVNKDKTSDLYYSYYRAMIARQEAEGVKGERGMDEISDLLGYTEEEDRELDEREKEAALLRMCLVVETNLHIMEELHQLKYLESEARFYGSRSHQQVNLWNAINSFLDMLTQIPEPMEFYVVCYTAEECGGEENGWKDLDDIIERMCSAQKGDSFKYLGLDAILAVRRCKKEN